MKFLDACTTAIQALCIHQFSSFLVYPSICLTGTWGRMDYPAWSQTAHKCVEEKSPTYLFGMTEWLSRTSSEFFLFLTWEVLPHTNVLPQSPKSHTQSPIMYRATSTTICRNQQHFILVSRYSFLATIKGNSCSNTFHPLLVAFFPESRFIAVIPNYTRSQSVLEPVKDLYLYWNRPGGALGKLESTMHVVQEECSSGIQRPRAKDQQYIIVGHIIHLTNPNWVSNDSVYHKFRMVIQLATMWCSHLHASHGN